MKIMNVEQLGSAVRKVRQGQGLTQEELAAMSGVGARFVREFEQGKVSCQIGKVLQVLAMLGIDIEISDES